MENKEFVLKLLRSLKNNHIKCKHYILNKEVVYIKTLNNGRVFSLYPLNGEFRLKIYDYDDNFFYDIATKDIEVYSFDLEFFTILTKSKSKLIFKLKNEQ